MPGNIYYILIILLFIYIHDIYTSNASVMQHHYLLRYIAALISPVSPHALFTFILHSTSCTRRQYFAHYNFYLRAERDSHVTSPILYIYMTRQYFASFRVSYYGYAMMIYAAPMMILLF